MNYKEVGIKGEVIAKNYILKHGYKVLQTNYMNKIGEIDIVAKHKNCIVFIEVKARTSNKFGMPQEAVNNFKQHKIRQVATAYLLEHNLFEKVNIRFDVVWVLGDKVEIIENAF